MNLYHGSTQEVTHPVLSKCRKMTDFGQGFYTTTHFEQSEKWAVIKKNRQKTDRAIVSVFEVKDNLLNDEKYKIHHFEKATKKWLDFVVSNRRGIENEIFDMVMGPVANDTLYATILLYEQGILTAEATIQQLNAYLLFDQLSFHSQTAIAELKFVKSIIV